MIVQLSPGSAGCQLSGGGCSLPLRQGMLLAHDQGILGWLFKGWGSGGLWAGGIPFSGGAGCESVPLLHHSVKWLFSFPDDRAGREGALEIIAVGSHMGNRLQMLGF